MNLTTPDIHYLGTLPPEVRAEVTNWHAALVTVSKPIEDSLKAIAKQFGVSLQTARRKYDLLRHNGWNVRVLVNRARVPEVPSALTPEFKEWIKQLVESNQRKTAPALRQFRKLWRSGAIIPGMDNSLPRHELPPGFSDDNIRLNIKDSFATLAVRSGLGAAMAKHGPQIFTTRAKLWYGSHLMIDDLWHDNFVAFGNQLVRVLELDALDVFSGYLVTHGCKPRFKKEDGTFDNLKEKYARLIVAGVYYTEGYSERGSEILAEHGTAAVSERCARILYDRSGGKIKLRESGITGEEQAVIGWRGQGKGNPRFKAALESLRNLKHNELGWVPAQTGRNRDERPEPTHGILAEATEELKVMAMLAVKDPARAAAFRLKVLDYHAHFLPLLMDVYREINQRDWHNLEGWHAAGNIAIEYRTAPTAAQWLSDGEFSQLPAISQQLLLQAATEDKRYLRQRKLSPAEVRARDGGNLVKFPSYAIVEILGEDCQRELKVQGAYFNAFEDQELAPEALRYESFITTPDGRQEKLPDDKYLVSLNPFNLGDLFVLNARGVLLGTAPRVTRVDRNDLAAVKAAYGRRSHQLAELKKPILARHAASVKAETARLAHNASVIHSETDENSELRRSALSAAAGPDEE